MHIHLPRSSKRFSFFVLLAVATVVRVIGIGTGPVDYDNAFSILFAEKGPIAMLAGTIQPGARLAPDIHPLAYYVTLWGWMNVFGESLPSVRMLSVLFGIGIVIFAYLLLKAMFDDPQLVFWGTLGIALSPFEVHYSQEIRMYALMAFAQSIATYALWQGLHSEQRRWWVLFAVCAALAQYTQNLAVFYLAPLALTPVLMKKWDKIKMVVLASLLALLLYLPWLLNLPSQLAKIQHSYWVSPPTIRTVFTTLLSFVTNLPVDTAWIPLAMSTSLAVVALVAYQTFLAIKNRQADLRRGLWLAYLAFVPGLLMFAVSLFTPVYIERALLCSAVMFWLWTAWALTKTGLPSFMSILSLVLLAGAIGLGLIMNLTYTDFPYGPYESLDASLNVRVQSGDLVLHSNKLTIIPAIYFDRSLKQTYITDPPGSPADTLAPATQKVLGLQPATSIETATAHSKKVWFIIFQQSIDEATAAGLSTHPDILWLDEHFQREGAENWGSLRLYVYNR